MLLSVGTSLPLLVSLFRVLSSSAVLQLFEIQVWFGFNVLSAVISSTKSTRKITLTCWAKDVHFTLFWLSKTRKYSQFFGGFGPSKLLLSAFPACFMDEKTTDMRSTTLKYQVFKTLYLKLFSSQAYSWHWSVILFFQIHKQNNFFTQQSQTIVSLP